MKRSLLASVFAACAAAAPATEPTPVFRDFDVKKEFAENPFTVFTGRGMLLCAGDREKSNAMTIGWGGLGTLWGRNDAVTVYVAESRHTKKFLDGATHFTVMAFDKEKQAKILAYMGRNSGRDGDKAAALELHLAYTENGTPYYEEAQAVYECETYTGSSRTWSRTRRPLPCVGPAPEPSPVRRPSRASSRTAGRSPLP